MKFKVKTECICGEKNNFKNNTNKYPLVPKGFYVLTCESCKRNEIYIIDDLKYES